MKIDEKTDRKLEVILIGVLLLSLLLGGCQLDVQGPSLTFKAIRKGENGNREYLSRGSGMTGGNNYSAGGGSMTSTGDGGTVYTTSAGRFLNKHVVGNTK
jgi:hypothetical protein